MSSKSPEARPIAFITGASSGIGAAYARKFAQLGYDLILTGRREKLLETLCASLEQRFGIRAGYILAEFADPDQLNDMVDTIKRTPNLRLLVNNAGYTRLEFFHEDDIDAQVDMIRVHCEAAVRITHAAIPILAKHRWAAIINVSSIAAFTIGARNLMYDATKGFLLNLSESLHILLKNTNICVQAVCPGFTRTDFHAKLGMNDDHEIFKKHRFMSPEEVVDKSLRCLEQDKVVCIPGWRNSLIAFVSRFTPRRILYRFYLRRRGWRRVKN
ncbi:SDR family oxidoreductase [candidate division WOR-3 bacterium]|nr:SDR family oxidoreductase [candidate division WOR-3 bacterium]